MSTMTTPTPAGSSLPQAHGAVDSDADVPSQSYHNHQDSHSRSQSDPDSRSASHYHPHSHLHRHSHGSDHHPYDLSDNDSDTNTNTNDITTNSDSDSDPHTQQLHLRQAPAVDGLANDVASPAFVTQVIQTVSLVQYVDVSGNPYQIATLYAPPATVLVDPSAGITIPIPVAGESPAPTAQAQDPAPSDDADPDGDMNFTSQVNVSSPAPSEIPIPSVVPPSESSLILSLSIPGLDTSAPPSPPATESVIQSSAPLPAPSSPPPFNHLNTTASSIVASSLATGNHTRVSAQAFSTSDSQSLTSSLDASNSDSTRPQSTSFVTSLSDSILSTISYDFSSTTSTFDPSVTTTLVGAGGRGGNGGEDTDDAADPQPEDSTDSDSPASSDGNLSTQDRQVIGGVVGGVAGAAIFAVLLLLFFRYRRRKGGLPQLGGYQPTNRGLVTDGGPDGGPGGGPAMAERSAPLAVTAALSRLTSRGPPPEPASAPATGERGFYRVSGKKLPSVLQVGGDGYTDPRESVMSGASDYYRGSQEFDPGSGGATRLALGSPMRPVSGVPIMRSGPARHVVPENPFEDAANPFLDPGSPPGLNDPVGRSLITQDGSRGSGSRFHERL